MYQSAKLSTQINWQLVASCLAAQPKALEERNKWILQEQAEMEKRLQLMKDLQLVEFKTQYWHFYRLPSSSANQLSFRIVFMPIEVILSENEDSTGIIKMSEDIERHTLQRLALNYASEGNLSKLKIVTKRLTEIISSHK